MLDNLKAAIFQRKKFLVVFFFVVFLPSLLLAALGIRAIYNEKYKLEQQALDQHREFLAEIKAEIVTFIDTKSSELRELASDPSMDERNLGAIRNLVLTGLRNELLSGEIVIWNAGDGPWFPAVQETPPTDPYSSIPDRWRKWKPDLAEAEALEFRRSEFSKAVSLYKGLLSRSHDRQVLAWITNRIARLEVKKRNYKRAIALYRSIGKDAGGLLTESGRPLELVAGLELLDCLRADGNYAGFFEESLATYSRLQKNPWSLNGERLDLYADMIKTKIDDVLLEKNSVLLPKDYLRTVKEYQSLLESQLSAWRLARIVEVEILRELRRELKSPTTADLPVHQAAIEFEGQDAVAVIAPYTGTDHGQAEGFLGMLLHAVELRGMIDRLVSRAGLPTVALIVRSNLTGRSLFGSETQNSPAANPVLTDVFQGYFLPWQFELYPRGDAGAGIPLHQNIFFWIILVLLLILFLGSGLIIRTIVQEANLLKLKSEFIASVSHEFKTPLTAMGAILEHLLSGEMRDPKRLQEYHQVLQHDSDKLKRLVKNVLDFSKIEDGKRDYQLRPTDLVQLAKREIRSFEKESGIEGLTVGFLADENVPPIPVDEEALSQALHNILDNAVKFSPGEKKIGVEIRNRLSAVEIAVRDRGVGIPENEQKKMFGKFYRGKQAASVSPTGTGLGLALVRHIVDAHKGNIIVQSRTGEGSRVSIILPVEEGER